LPISTTATVRISFIAACLSSISWLELLAPIDVDGHIPKSCKRRNAVETMRFRAPVRLSVDGSVQEIEGVREALLFLEQWPAHRRGPVHGCAVNACQAGLGGGLTADGARRSFESFARITGLLVRGARPQPVPRPRPAAPDRLPAGG
jgi:hypothetical protein